MGKGRFYIKQPLHRYFLLILKLWRKNEYLSLKFSPFESTFELFI